MLMAKLVLWNDIDWCSVWVIDIHGCGVKSQPVAHRAWCPVLFISFNLSSGGYYTTFGVVEQSIRFSEHGGGKNFAATALRAFSIAAACGKVGSIGVHASIVGLCRNKPGTAPIRGRICRGFGWWCFQSRRQTGCGVSLCCRISPPTIFDSYDYQACWEILFKESRVEF